MFLLVFSPADAADSRRGFFKPLITQITLISNKLQIEQILHRLNF